MSFSPWYFLKFINDFNKDGVDEIITSVWYGRPGSTMVRLIEEKDSDYVVKNELEISGGVSNIELKDIPKGYQSVVLDKSACFGTGMGCEIKTILTYIDGKFKTTWSGTMEYHEDVSVPFKSVFDMEFKDIDKDGNPEIIYSGIKQEVKYNEETESSEVVEEVIEEIYKWDDSTKQYEKT